MNDITTCFPLLAKACLREIFAGPASILGRKFNVRFMTNVQAHVPKGEHSIEPITPA